MIDAITSLLRCPLCGKPFTRRENSLVCGQRHCYDIARQGYVNLAPDRKEKFYTRQLFESRARVFEGGLFAPVVDALSDALTRFVPCAAPVVVDAGCGEGYYIRRVCPGREMTRVGFDLSKDAVRLAARGDKEAAFFAADLAHIPLADGCADAVLDVFTPANYAEFGRILKPGGVLLKLAPRAGYLRELRAAAQGLLRNAAYDGGQVDRYAREHMDVLAQQTITYTQSVSPELARELARMTPMLAGIDTDALDLSGITQITIDETLTIGTVKVRSIA